MIPTNSQLPRLPGIVVLAAGSSRRLGRPKAQARIAGRTLWQHMETLLAPFVRYPIYVVVAPRSPLRQAASKPGWRCLVNPRCGQGLSTSVRCGVRAGRHQPALLFLPLDLPLLRRSDLTRLLRRWRAGRRCVVARRQDNGAAIPLILPKRLFGLVVELRADAGLRPLLRDQKVASQMRLLDLPNAAHDVDTAADLQAVRRRRRAQFCSSR